MYCGIVRDAGAGNVHLAATRRQSAAVPAAEVVLQDAVLQDQDTASAEQDCPAARVELVARAVVRQHAVANGQVDVAASGNSTAAATVDRGCGIVDEAAMGDVQPRPRGGVDAAAPVCLAVRYRHAIEAEAAGTQQDGSASVLIDATAVTAAMGKGEVAQGDLGRSIGDLEDPAGVVAADRDLAAVVVPIAVDGDIMAQRQLPAGPHQRRPALQVGGDE